MTKPKFVTFTGLDERTDLNRVIELSRKYPVEWGILFSARNTGNVNRYPNPVEAYKFFNSGLRLAAHICGRYSTQILENGEEIEITEFLKGNFSRTQINVADGESLVIRISPQNAVSFASQIGASKAIIQCTGNFPPIDSVDWLYDRSGGTGTLTDNWDAKASESSAFCGYAGGMSAENIKEVLENINKTHPVGKEYWIDMEGRVRTEDWLDLDKCEAVLRSVYGY